MPFLKLYTFTPRDGNDFSDSDSDDATAWIVLENAEALGGAIGDAADAHPRRHEGEEHVNMPFRTRCITALGSHTSSSSSHMAYFPDDTGAPHEGSTHCAGGSQAEDENDCDRCQEGQLCGEHNQAHHQALHAVGRCQPCAYANRKANGCRNGFLCSYCHFCDNSDYQAWKRRVKRIKQQGPHHS
eukprot:TRINITY_DN17799_c0_g1_i8.p1 TRINITY_DN17799_c0_g1~~TRINITY_DN17799_c0_g1_i8.p1  ORF type:complete len:185 (-),score=10.70 TRINITY_DN17799_c0_g1_i8:481-1035(-)